MNVRTSLILCLFIGLFTGLLLFPPSVTADEPSSFSVQAAEEDIDDADSIHINIDLHEDGSATWTIAYRYELDDDIDQDAFNNLSDDIEENPNDYLNPFQDRINNTVALASEETNRDMSATQFAISTRVEDDVLRDIGVVEYTYQWNEFATADNGEIRAGDAITGFILDDEMRMLVQWPDQYSLELINPDADDELENGIVWYGDETEFIAEENQPQIVLSEDNLLSTALLIPILIVILAIAGWILYRREELSEASSSTESTSVPTTEPTEQDDEPDWSLLSNEEKVIQLLEQHDGRMKQQKIIEEFDWTDAKTSKVVGSLRDQGEIETVRVGRENVLTLPDTDVLSGGSSSDPSSE